MAGQGNSSEEDYLDNLLKSILDDSDETKEKINSDGDFDDSDLSDVDLDAMSDDMFDRELEMLGSEFSGDDFESPAFSENDKTAAEETVKPKKRRGLFGRRKKKNKSEEAPAVEYVPLFEKADEHDDEQDYKSGDIFAVPEDEHTDEQSKNESESLQENDELEFLDIFADNGQEEAEENTEYSEESVEDDMKGLYDILGMTEPEESSESDGDELKKLENEEPKKRGRKNKKEKASKKRRLWKKDKAASGQEENQTAENDLLNVQEFTESGDDNNTENTGSGEVFDGLGLGDIFADSGEETDDENSRLISGMDNGEYDESDIMRDEGSEPKKKKEKKKKEKKPKKEKPKKPKKKKEKKEKKPKKPKKPDEIIHIPKAFIIFSISLIVMLTVGLIFGGNYRDYKERTDAAVAYYVNKDFEAAYNELSGLDMNDEDEYFFSQVQTIMYVQRHYSSYKSLYGLKKYDKALHTLLRGVKMYDKYKEQARELGCFDDMTAVLGWIDAALLEKYGLSESEARELNLLNNQYVYAEKVYEISDKAKEREEALEKENNEKQEAESGASLSDNE